MFFWICKILLWLPCKLLYPTKVIGKKNLKNYKGILVCNHQSNLDAVLLLVNIKPVFHTLVKKELMSNWFSKLIFKHLHCIPVDRKNMDISAIKSSMKILKSGKTLLVFPSGTRKKDVEDVKELKKGTSMLAYKTNSPVIPVIFNKKPKLFRRTKIYIGTPINFNKEQEGLTSNEIYASMTLQIENEMLKLLQKDRIN